MPNRVNYGREYVESAEPNLWADPWCDEQTALKQRALAERELADWFNGTPHAAFDPFCELLQRTRQRSTLLEIGCGVGHYSRVTRHKSPETSYVGCDISKPMIELAREQYPGVPFLVRDAQDMQFGDDAFDIVVLSAVIGHLPDWRKAVSEACRISKRYVMFHRIGTYNKPSEPERLSVKIGYGKQMNERYFDESAMLAPWKLLGQPIRWGDLRNEYMLSFLAEVQ